MEKDPVCGMQVEKESARHTAEHAGTTYYFCAPGCKKAFESDPEKFMELSYKPSMELVRQLTQD